ncbi:hypothetical protein DXM13_02190 [Fructilactobacillus sanfranciscensis]|nr:hypothetical protein DXM13_02190 [Fructilactobacillus sanfranciscensis]
MMGTTFLKVSAEVNSKIIEPKIDPTAVIAEILTHSDTFFFSSCRYDSTALVSLNNNPTVIVTLAVIGEIPT